MPELPEVETVVRYLRTKIINQTIKQINLLYFKVLQNTDPVNFNDFLLNETFIDITRKGKYLIFHLTNHKVLVIHLRMEGKLFVQPLNSAPNFSQLICEFILNEEVLRFYDTRKFGTFEVCYEQDLINLKSLQKLAMDANSHEFTADYLFDITRKSRIAIKTFLLDQSNVAGIGNIYVNEILFMSGILPTKPTWEINYEQCKNIVNYSKEILNASIAKNGTTIHTYKFNEYQSGGFQSELKVHGRHNKSCVRCGHCIKFCKVNGRGTYFCQNCQK